MASFYTFRHADLTKSTFTVTTVDGPVVPTSSGFYPGAISANTSIVLLGRGQFDYGQPIQQNFIYMLENFAAPVPPVGPMQGQLWYKNSAITNPASPGYGIAPLTAGLYVYNGTTWKNIPISGSISDNFDMSGFRITNLGNPVNPTDAINLQTSDMRYVNVAGDIMTGSLSLSAGTITVPAQVGVPPSNQLVAWGYTDNYITTTATTISSTQIAAAVALLPAMYVSKAGDTMDGTLTIATGDASISTGDVNVAQGNVNVVLGDVDVTSGNVHLLNGSTILEHGNVQIDDGAIIVSGSTASTFNKATFAGSVNFNTTVFVNNSILRINGLSGLIDMNDNRIAALKDPVLDQDATNKRYVDSKIAAVPGDGVVISGTVDPNGSVTLNRSNGMSPVVLTGEVVPRLYPLSPAPTTISQQLPGVSQVPVATALDIFDRQIYALSSRIKKRVIDCDGTVSTFPAGTSVEAGSNRLQVFLDGVKQLQTDYSEIELEILPNIGFTTNNLVDTTYSFDITVGSTLYTDVEVELPAGNVTYTNIVNGFNDSCANYVGGPIPAVWDANSATITASVPGASITIETPSSIVYPFLFTATTPPIIPSPDASDSTGLAASTSYSFNLSTHCVDHSDVTITTAASPVSYGDLIGLINAELIARSIPIECDATPFTFSNNPPYDLAKVDVLPATTGTDLFTAIGLPYPITPTNMTDDTGLTVSTEYKLTVVLNGITFTDVAITTGATSPVTYSDISNLLQTEFGTLEVPIYIPGGSIAFLNNRPVNMDGLIVLPSSGATDLFAALGSPYPTFPIPMGTDDTGLAVATTYAFDISINCVLYTNVQVTTDATGPITFSDLNTLIDAEFVARGIQAACSPLYISFYSLDPSNPNEVVVLPPTTGTDLVASLAPQSLSTSATQRAYVEDGAYGEQINSITFHTAPPVGSVVETIVYPA